MSDYKPERYHKDEDDFYDVCEYEGTQYAWYLIQKLEKQNKIMREALEFYAARDTQDHITDGMGHSVPVYDIDLEYMEHPISDFNVEFSGKRARQALKEVGEV